MAEELQLDVVTPERLVLRQNVTMVVAPGVTGEFGVLPGHVTYMTPLGTGILAWKTTDSLQAMVVSEGLAEVVNNKVTVLAERADLLEEIDPAFAAEELKKLEEQLRGKGMLDEDFGRLRAEVERNVARLRLTARP